MCPDGDASALQSRFTTLVGSYIHAGFYLILDMHMKGLPLQDLIAWPDHVEVAAEQVAPDLHVHEFAPSLKQEMLRIRGK